MSSADSIIAPDEPILITGAAGFIGSRVVENLAARGYRDLRCFARPTGNVARLQAIAARVAPGVTLRIVRGNLLSPDDCAAASDGVALVYHLAAGRGEKSIPDAFMNSVVTTRNLIEGCLRHGRLKRFVSISSFSVYANAGNPGGRLLDESAPMEPHPEQRGDAYSFAKVKQDELVMGYGRERGLPYVLVRPGVVYGPGNEAITGRVGLGTFGLFLHLGGGNPIPLTYVENCADAIVLAGLRPGVEGEAFNVVDDDLPSSRLFLRRYKREVRRFGSLFVPRPVSYLLCALWEGYAGWSRGQLPNAFNRKVWTAYWKKTRYTNEKLKRRLGWTPRITTAEGLHRHFESCRHKLSNA